jgi:hypothetical protein
MMQHWPRIVIAMLFLLTVATSASAECAWVLWGSNTSSEALGTVTWTPHGAYGSENGCGERVGVAVESVRGGILKLPAKAGQSIETGRDWAEVTAMKPEWTKPVVVTLRFLCLPDTVDPRGPKGK